MIKTMLPSEFENEFKIQSSSDNRTHEKQKISYALIFNSSTTDGSD
jgi:hypothetical protein